MRSKITRRTKIKETNYRHSVGTPHKTVFSESQLPMSEQLKLERERLFGKDTKRI